MQTSDRPRARSAKLMSDRKQLSRSIPGTTLPIVGPTSTSQDVLTEILRDGAKRLLAEAIQAEVADWIGSHAHIKDVTGHRQVVRNGYLPERTIQTGLGDIQVQQPRVHDRRPADQRVEFTSSILPPYLKRTKSLDELIPWLYLKGLYFP